VWQGPYHPKLIPIIPVVVAETISALIFNDFPLFMFKKNFHELPSQPLALSSGICQGAFLSIAWPPLPTTLPCCPSPILPSTSVHSRVVGSVFQELQMTRTRGIASFNLQNPDSQYMVT
jgi:hypothetical protein